MNLLKSQKSGLSKSISTKSPKTTFIVSNMASCHVLSNKVRVAKAAHNTTAAHISTFGEKVYILNYKGATTLLVLNLTSCRVLRNKARIAKAAHKTNATNETLKRKLRP